MITFNFIVAALIPIICRSDVSNIPNCIKVTLSDQLGDGWGQDTKLVATIRSTAVAQDITLIKSDMPTAHLLCIDSQNNYTAKFEVISNKREKIIAPWEIAWSLDANQGLMNIFGYYQSQIILEYSPISSSWNILSAQHVAREKFSCAAQVGALVQNCFSESSAVKLLTSTLEHSRYSEFVIMLYDTMSNGWFLSNGRGSAWYITSGDGHNPIAVGSMKSGQSSQSDVLSLAEGSYQLRVTGALDSFANTHSWQFCGVSGSVGDVLQFQVKNNKCVIKQHTSYLVTNSATNADLIPTTISTAGLIAFDSLESYQNSIMDNYSSLKSDVLKSLQDMCEEYENKFKGNKLQISSVEFTENSDKNNVLFEITLVAASSDSLTSKRITNEEILRNSIKSAVTSAINAATPPSISRSLLESTPLTNQQSIIRIHGNTVEITYLVISKSNHIIHSKKRKLQLLKGGGYEMSLDIANEQHSQSQEDHKQDESTEEEGNSQASSNNIYVSSEEPDTDNATTQTQSTDTSHSTSNTRSNSGGSSTGGGVHLDAKVDYRVTMGIVAICGLLILFILIVVSLAKENNTHKGNSDELAGNSNDARENEYNQNKFDISSTNGDLESSFLGGTSEHSIDSSSHSSSVITTRIETNHTTLFNQSNLVSSLVPLNLSKGYKFGDQTPRNPGAYSFAAAVQ